MRCFTLKLWMCKYLVRRAIYLGGVARSAVGLSGPSCSMAGVISREATALRVRPLGPSMPLPSRASKFGFDARARKS